MINNTPSLQNLTVSEVDLRKCITLVVKLAGTWSSVTSCHSQDHTRGCKWHDTVREYDTGSVIGSGDVDRLMFFLGVHNI